MFFRLDMSTLTRVMIMGQIRQPMGWENNVTGIRPNYLIFVRQGDMTFTVHEQTYELSRGSYLFIAEGQSYHVFSREGCQYTFVHFELPCEAVDTVENEPMPFPEATAYPYTLPMTHQDHALYVAACGKLSGEQEKVWPLLTECDMYRHALTANRKLRIDIHFAQILSLLDARSIQADYSGWPSVLSRMLMFIHEHYTQAISLSSISQEFGMSRQYVMRLFQKHLKTTVTQYIIQLKMSHALELLRHSNFRIGEVAEILGYTNAYYFCRQFRQQFGMTPTEYIRRCIQE